MTNAIALFLSSFLLMGTNVPAERQLPVSPAETVVIRNGSVTLHGLLWRPQGSGPFPAILLNHGSGRTREELARLGPYEKQAEAVGPVFASHGFVFLYLFRRGVGLSSDQGTNSVDLMNSEFATHGQAARNALQIRLLENRELGDAAAGLRYLRARRDVDNRKLVLIGDSFGSSLTLLLAEREHRIKAVVAFSCAGNSWQQSTQLQNRLLSAVSHITAPVFFLHAENDYSVAPGKTLAARLEQLGRTHRLQIYPAIGSTPEEGHGLLYLGVNNWEADVFEFLAEHLRN